VRLAEARRAVWHDRNSAPVVCYFPVQRGGRFSCSFIRRPRSSCPHGQTWRSLLGENRIRPRFPHPGILPDSTLIARKLVSTPRILCRHPATLARRVSPGKRWRISLAITVSLRALDWQALHGCWTGPRGQNRSGVLDLRRHYMQAVVCAASRFTAPQLPSRSPSVCEGRAVAPRSRRLHYSGWRNLCRVSAQPTRFRLWSRHSWLAAERLAATGTSEMNKRSSIQPKLGLTSAAHDQLAMRPRMIAAAIQRRWCSNFAISAHQQAQLASLP